MAYHHSAWRVLAGLGLSLVLNLASFHVHASDHSFVKEYETEELTCGKNHTSAYYRITDPLGKSDGNLFAIVLNGSPGTQYFGDNGPLFKDLVDGLVKQGYKVLELRYKSMPRICGTAGLTDGFYSVCCSQGLPATISFNDQIYQIAQKALGFDPNNFYHQVIGVGFSLGGVQLQGMAFMSGRYFSKIAITGVLFGNVVEGCQKGRPAIPPVLDGMAWTGFVGLADAVTSSTRGCSQLFGAELEYTHHHNFDQLPYRYYWDIGLFEGEDLTQGGHPLQAEYIAIHRGKAPTTLNLYPGCGHNPWGCESGGAKLNQDILDYLKPIFYRH